MKRIDLIKEQHEVKIGDVCGTIEPNITEDSLFYDNGEVIGFYIKDMNKYSERLTKLSDVANKEFRSKNVPKSVMTRSSIMKRGLFPIYYGLLHLVIPFHHLRIG